MKKSVIFWNITLIIGVSLCLIFGNDLVRMGIALISMPVGMMIFVLMLSSGYNPLDIKTLKTSNFHHWWAYITPFGILIVLACITSNYIYKFNYWLNK